MRPRRSLGRHAFLLVRLNSRTLPFRSSSSLAIAPPLPTLNLGTTIVSPTERHWKRDSYNKDIEADATFAPQKSEKDWRDLEGKVGAVNEEDEEELAFRGTTRSTIVAVTVERRIEE